MISWPFSDKRIINVQFLLQSPILSPTDIIYVKISISKKNDYFKGLLTKKIITYHIFRNKTSNKKRLFFIKCRDTSNPTFLRLIFIFLYIHKDVSNHSKLSLWQCVKSTYTSIIFILIWLISEQSQNSFSITNLKQNHQHEPAV